MLTSNIVYRVHIAQSGNASLIFEFDKPAVWLTSLGFAGEVVPVECGQSSSCTSSCMRPEGLPCSLTLLAMMSHCGVRALGLVPADSEGYEVHWFGKHTHTGRHTHILLVCSNQTTVTNRYVKGYNLLPSGGFDKYYLIIRY